MGNVQFDDVGMSQQLEILDLSLDPARHISCHQPLAVDNLESDFLPADLMRGQLNLAKGALTQSLDYGILAQALRRFGVFGLGLLGGGSRCSGRRGVRELRSPGGAVASPPRSGHGHGELLKIFEILIIDGGRHGEAGR